MAYQSLYRRYRPQRFGEIRGQEPVVRALQNAAREGRVGHAYLFSGPRGTGKTSTARILAKILNCTNPTDGEPCGVCDSCVAIEAGTSMDVHELDAASNNGVEAIRDLIAKAALGTPGRTKVYILDEVHMLSTAASNALLKTLEEPPGHVVFILATTDPQKVLPTIKSRTQHFEFSLLGADELADHLRYVIDDASLEVADDALDQVLHEGAGSVRDALSALDRVAAGGGKAETGEAVDELVDALCERDTGAALVALANDIRRGRDPRLVGEALLARLRDAFLAAMGTGLDHLPDTQREVVAGFAQRLGPAAITRALEALGEALVEMRQSPDPRIPLEVALVRLTRPDSDLSPAALLERIERLERRGSAPAAAAGEAGEPAPSSAPSSSSASPSTESPADAGRAALAQAEPPAPEPRPEPDPAARPRLGTKRQAAPPADVAPTAEPSAPAANDPGFPDRDELTLAWGDVLLDKLPSRAKARFKGGRFTAVTDGSAVFALPNTMHRDRCQEFKADVEEVLAAHFGRPVPLTLVVDAGSAAPDSPPSTAPVAEGPGKPTSEGDDDDIDLVDPNELVDAVGQDQTAVARLAETFGDVEVIEQDQ